MKTCSVWLKCGDQYQSDNREANDKTKAFIYIHYPWWLISFMTMRNIVTMYYLFQCLRDNVELLCNAAEMFYNSGDYNSAKSFFQRVNNVPTIFDKKMLRILQFPSHRVPMTPAPFHTVSVLFSQRQKWFSQTEQHCFLEEGWRGVLVFVTATV